MKKLYDWKRFWCRRDGFINLDDNGFLSDPVLENSIYHPTDVVPFNKIGNYPCLIILGSAGVGKTTTLNKEFTFRLNAMCIADMSQKLHYALWSKLYTYLSDEVYQWLGKVAHVPEHHFYFEGEVEATVTDVVYSRNIYNRDQLRRTLSWDEYIEVGRPEEVSADW